MINLTELICRRLYTGHRVGCWALRTVHGYYGIYTELCSYAHHIDYEKYYYLGNRVVTKSLLLRKIYTIRNELYFTDFKQSDFC